MSDPIAVLLCYAGAYRGTGLNHAGEPFDAFMMLRPVLEKGVSLWFRAEGGGIVFHEELSLVAPRPDGGAGMSSLNTNIPFVQEFEARSAGSGTIEFHGRGDDPTSFRERITLETLDDGSLRYAFAWATPGEKMQPRSAATLYPAAEERLEGRRPLP